MTKKAEIIRNRVTKIKELCQEQFDTVELYKNLYRSRIQVDDTYEWDYSLFDPQIFPIIRNYMSRSNPSKTNIQLYGRTGQDLETKQVNQDFLNWELNQNDLINVFSRILYSGYSFGKGFGKTGWHYEPSVVIEEKTESGEIIRKVVMRQIQDRASVLFVPFNRLLIPNRNIPTLHDQPYIIELVSPTIASMEKDNEIRDTWSKTFLAKAKKYSGKSRIDYQAEVPQEDDDPGAKTIDLACMRTKENEVFYVTLDDFYDKPCNIDQDNEFYHGHYPYLEFTPFPEDDEFYTASVIEQVADLQIASNEILNQSLTNVRAINNEMWIAGSDANSTPDYQFTKRPNGIIRVAGDANQIQQVRQQDNTIPADRMGQSIQTKIERASGISSLYASGASGGGTQVNQTARGAMVIDKNIETNISWLIDLFGDQIVKKIGEHFLELNSQFVTEEQTFHVTGKKGVSSLIKIKPEDISADFDVYVSSTAQQKQTPASIQASLQNLLTVLAQNSKALGVEIDPVPIINTWLDSYPEMENVDNVVITPDEKSASDINMIMRGQMPEVKWSDNHEVLIQNLIVYLAEQEFSPEIMAMGEEYVKKHARFIQAKKEVAAMTAPVPPMGVGPEQVNALMQSETAGVPGEEGAYNLEDMGTGNTAFQP